MSLNNAEMQLMDKIVDKMDNLPKRRGRKPKMPDSGIGGSPLREQVIF